MGSTSRHTREVHAALTEFYAPGLEASSFVERAFALTSSLVDCSLNSHGVIDRRTGVLTANFDCEPPGLGDAFGAFGRLMNKYQPFRFDPSVNGGKPFSARDFYTATAFQDLDIYQEVYRPMGYRDHCFMHVPSDPGSVVFVGFIRDGRPFDEKEKELLALIQPHLANGRRLAIALTAMHDSPTSPELFCRAGFTPRESDVLFWLTRGKSNEEISQILGLRADSVSRHLRAIYEKVGVEHRVAAMMHSIRLGQTLYAESVASESGRVLLSVPCSSPTG